MGLLDTGINFLKSIKEIVSDEPFDVGLRFENYVQGLFSPKYFSIVEKTHSPDTNSERYVESSMNPDFVFRYIPTNEKFAVECKYRSALFDGMLKWSYPAQLKRYQDFAYDRNIPTYLVIGLGGTEDEPNEMFNIPLKEAKFPNLKNNGLHWSHIISKKDGGGDSEVNCLALCPNCSFTFDLVIKPAVYKAHEKLNNGRTVPESWKNGESRKGS